MKTRFGTYLVALGLFLGSVCWPDVGLAKPAGWFGPRPNAGLKTGQSQGLNAKIQPKTIKLPDLSCHLAGARPVGRSVSGQELNNVSALASGGGAGAGDLYVDATSGNDTTGDGTSGHPYKSLTKALGITNASGGGTIHATSGSSLISFSITDTDETIPLVITASNTTLKNWSGKNAPVIDANEAGTFNVLWIYGSEAARLTNINVGGASGSELEIKKAASNNGLYVIDVEYVNNLNIHDCWIHDAQGGISPTNTTVRGISCEDTSSGTVQYCTIDQVKVNNGQGIVFGSSTNATVKNCTVTGLAYREDTEEPSYGTDGIWFFGVNGCTITDNVVGGTAEADKIKSYNTACGIAFNGRVGHPEDTCDNIVARNNLVQSVESYDYDTHLPAFDAYGIAGENCLNYDLTGNRVYYCVVGIGFTPIVAPTALDSQDAGPSAEKSRALAVSQTIAQNYCDHNVIGIALLDSAPGVAIRDNYCRENVWTADLAYEMGGLGITLVGSDFSGATISGNHCNDNRDEIGTAVIGGMGITLINRTIRIGDDEPAYSDFTNLTITGNECRRNSVATSDISFFGGTGIALLEGDISGSAISGGNICEQNDITGDDEVLAGGSGIIIWGTGTNVVIDGNYCNENVDSTEHGLLTGMGIGLGFNLFVFSRSQPSGRSRAQIGLYGDEFSDCQITNNQANENAGGLGVGLVAYGAKSKISRNSQVNGNQCNSEEGFFSELGGGIGILSLGDESEISYNTVRDNRSNPGGGDETGIGIYSAGDQSKVFWNDCRDNGSMGLVVAGADLEIYRNVASGHHNDLVYDEDVTIPAAGLYHMGFSYGIDALAEETSLIENNTFANNKRGLYLAGEEGDELVPAEVRNNIMAFNSEAAAEGEIAGLASVFEYNDLYDVETLINVTAGTGCISADPKFVNSLSDFHLLASSPCIDTGDPASSLDPDGTRRDMGVFYYNQVPAPTHASVLINGGDAYTNDRNVILTLSCKNAWNMYIYGDIEGEGVKRNYTTTYPVTLTAGEGDKTVRLVFTNITGRAEATDSIYYSTSLVPARAFSLSDKTSGSKLYTNEDEVSLTINETLARALFFKSPEEQAQSEPPVISEAMYSENSDFSGASWQAYTTATTFTLTPAEGNKTVYGKFKNQAGNVSSATNSTIILDKTPPNPLADIQTSRGSVIETGDPVGRIGINVKGILTDLLSGVDPDTILVDLVPMDTGFLSEPRPIEIQGTSITYDPVTGIMTCSKDGLDPGSYEIDVNCSDKAGNPMAQFTLSLVEVLAADAGEGIWTLTQPVVVKISDSEYRITYSLSADMPVDLRIYNMGGAMIWQKTVAAGDEGGGIGFNSVVWDGRDAFGRPLERGVYIIRIVSAGRLIGTVRFVKI